MILKRKLVKNFKELATPISRHPVFLFWVCKEKPQNCHVAISLELESKLGTNVYINHSTATFIAFWWPGAWSQGQFDVLGTIRSWDSLNQWHDDRRWFYVSNVFRDVFHASVSKNIIVNHVGRCSLCSIVFSPYLDVGTTKLQSDYRVYLPSWARKSEIWFVCTGWFKTMCTTLPFLCTEVVSKAKLKLYGQSVSLHSYISFESAHKLKLCDVVLFLQ